MKLNNKGFAFSTMLYGTLALITVILYAILSIFDSSASTTYYYGEAIRDKLNECVNEEITLENCYSSGSANCDTTSYHACLGISNNTIVNNDKLIAEKLLETKVASGDGLREDTYEENRYIYVGNTVNNYIEYSGKTWRILSIEPDGTVRLIDYTANIFNKWDNNAEDMWANSTLKAYLNGNYLATIIDTSKLTSGKWKATIIYHEGLDNLSLDDLKIQEDNREGEDSMFAQVGLLNIGDYMKATNNTSCQSSILDSSLCSSWLSEYKSWTLNIDGDQRDSSVAYYFDTDDKLSEDNTSIDHKVYPIIVLNRNNVINGGNGTISNPYVLK